MLGLEITANDLSIHTFYTILGNSQTGVIFQIRRWHILIRVLF